MKWGVVLLFFFWLHSTNPSPVDDLQVPANQSATALRPLHTGTAEVMRFGQFEAMLDVEMGKVSFSFIDCV